jgi:UDP-N-acetylglucosamine:LPS N-acetylglucosamine transferase
MNKSDTVIIKNLGWVDNMAEVLTATDIVFGKAGPNFLFDSIAVKKPFVAITHIGGQEDGNVELIRKKKLGWVREKGGIMVDFFLEFVENPEKYLEKYKKNIEIESEKNKKGLENLEEAVKKEIPPKALLQ